jgi:hypothetical protein
MKRPFYFVIVTIFLGGCTPDETTCANDLLRNIDDLIQIVETRQHWSAQEREEARAMFSRVATQVHEVLQHEDRNACDYRIVGDRLILK